MIRFLSCVVLLLGLTACQTVHRDFDAQDENWPVVGETTGAELFERLGVPRKYREEGQDIVVTWNKVRGDGRGAGLGSMGGSLFYWGHMHMNIHMLHVTLGPDYVVKDIRMVDSDGEPIVTMWPY